jgi:hypothetical protein
LDISLKAADWASFSNLRMMDLKSGSMLASNPWLFEKPSHLAER